VEEILQAWEACSLKAVYIQTNKHTSASEWKISREMGCFCSVSGLLKTEKQDCSDSDFIFFLGKAALCLGMVMRVDRKIALGRGMYVRLYLSENSSYLGFTLMYLSQRQHFSC